MRTVIYRWKHGRNVIIFIADIISSVHLDNQKNIYILSEEPKQELDDTTLTAEAKYPINFTQPNIMKSAVSYFLMLQNISIQSKKILWNKRLYAMFS